MVFHIKSSIITVSLWQHKCKGGINFVNIRCLMNQQFLSAARKRCISVIQTPKGLTWSLEATFPTCHAAAKSILWYRYIFYIDSTKESTLILLFSPDPLDDIPGHSLLCEGSHDGQPWRDQGCSWGARTTQHQEILAQACMDSRDIFNLHSINNSNSDCLWFRLFWSDW